VSPQGRPSRNRANPGLKDAIPLGLTKGYYHTLLSRPFFYSIENVESLFSFCQPDSCIFEAPFAGSETVGTNYANFFVGLPGGSFLEPVKAIGGGFGEPVLRSPFSPTFLPRQPLFFPLRRRQKPGTIPHQPACTSAVAIAPPGPDAARPRRRPGWAPSARRK